MKSFVITGMAIVGIIILEVVALLHGINGTMFALAVAAISGLGGYEIRHGQEKVRRRRNNPKDD